MDYNPLFEIWYVLIPLGIVFQIVYIMIAMYRNVPVKKYKTWRKESIETALTSAEFVQKVQKICLLRKWNLVEISGQHAVIRTYPSLMSYGMFYYIEYVAGEKNVVNVHARNAIAFTFIYIPAQISLLNMFYKV